MSSRWYCRVLDQEWGPLSFADLAALLRAGTLSEDDAVRRDGSQEWTPARNVVGLLHMARAPAENPDSPAPARAAKHVQSRAGAAPPDSQVETASRWTQARAIPSPSAPWFGGRARLWWIAAAVLAAAVAVVGWQARQPEIFPAPKGTPTSASDGFHVPLLGQVTLAEYLLVWIDLALVAASVIWLVRRYFRRGAR